MITFPPNLKHSRNKISIPNYFTIYLPQSAIIHFNNELPKLSIIIFHTKVVGNTQGNVKTKIYQLKALGEITYYTRD